MRPGAETGNLWNMAEKKPATASQNIAAPQSPSSGNASLGPNRMGGIKSFLLEIREMISGLRSGDGPTRWMSLIFALSTLGLLTVTGYGIHYGWTLREKSLELSESQKAAQHLSEFLRKQAEEAKLKASLLPLGTFTIELKALPSQKPIPGVMNLAEIDLTVESDSKLTRDWIESHLPQVRNQISNVLTASDRNELMSRDGKKRLRRALLEQINSILPRGRAQDIYITKLVMT